MVGGGQVSVPINSPHLRKSGSRHVISDNGEQGNVIEEGFIHSLEVEEMKNVSAPLSNATILPSPILLWRFKVVLFFAWGFCCSKIGWDSVMRMSEDLRDLFLYEAFLYYNPLLLVTMMVWLWGICLWVFAQSTVNYAKIFDLDQSHLTHREMFRCATWMTIVVPTSMTAYLYLYSHGEVSLAASQPVSNLQHVYKYDDFIGTIVGESDNQPHPGFLSRRYVGCDVHILEETPDKKLSLYTLITQRRKSSVLLYAAATMLLISPFDIFYLTSRYFLLRTLWRIALPLQAITFADFFVADILTSMSKVATIAWFEADSVCGSHAVAIPVVLVLPYLFRLFQCLRQYKDTGEKNTLLNALKYSTAVPVIFLSALKYHVLPDYWTTIYRPLWLLSSVVNSLYSFYWDVTRDWDLSGFTRIFLFNKPHICSHLIYGRSWVYYWVIGSNLILRCTWTYKLSAHLRHNYITLFLITALEMLRRFQWIFFRVENEWNKITSKSSVQIIAMTDLSNEQDKLLNSTSDDHHSV